MALKPNADKWRSKIRNTRLTSLLMTSGLMVPISVLAQVANPEQQHQSDQIEQRQRDQIEQQRQLQQTQAEKRSSQLKSKNKPRVPSTEPSTTPSSEGSNRCFTIERIDWQQGNIKVPNHLKRQAQKLIRDEHGRSACLGQEQLIALQKALNGSLIEHGNITSKIAFPAQNLTTHALQIDWYPGVISGVGYGQGKPIGGLALLFPFQVGRLYNQRHADQALENLKRLPSQSHAGIDLKPGEQAGSSQIEYQLESIPWYKRIHGSIGMDNSGSKSTGQYQGNGSLTIDSPLHLNDQLTLNYNHNTDASSEQHNSQTLGVYWDVNIGYLNLNAGYTNSRYLWTALGTHNDTIDIDDTANQGKSQDYSVGMGYMLYRNSSSKFQAAIKLGHKISHNYVSGAELTVQQKDYDYLDGGLTFTHYWRDQQYTVHANLRQSLSQLSKNPGVMADQPDWDGKWRVYSADANAMMPFALGAWHLKYNSTVKLQYGERPLPASEYFSIGSRYSVRGFDERTNLSGEDGWVWRNEIAHLYGANQAQQIYLGLDYGGVHGPAVANTQNNHLLGSAVGLRGLWRHLNYDLALGLPLDQPRYLHTHSPSFYGSLGITF